MVEKGHLVLDFCPQGRLEIIYLSDILLLCTSCLIDQCELNYSFIFKNVNRLTPLPLAQQVPRAWEAGLTLLPGSDGPAWEHGGSWQAVRQDLASCSTSAAPLLPARQSAGSAGLPPLLPLPPEHFPSGLAPAPVNDAPVWPVLLRSLKLVCLMYFLLKSVQMAALLSLAAGLGSYKITCK